MFNFLILLVVTSHPSGLSNDSRHAVIAILVPWTQYIVLASHRMPNLGRVPQHFCRNRDAPNWDLVFFGSTPLKSQVESWQVIGTSRKICHCWVPAISITVYNLLISYLFNSMILIPSIFDFPWLSYYASLQFLQLFWFINPFKVSFALALGSFESNWTSALVLLQSLTWLHLQPEQGCFTALLGRVCRWRDGPGMKVWKQWNRLKVDWHNLKIWYNMFAFNGCLQHMFFIVFPLKH